MILFIKLLPLLKGKIGEMSKEPHVKRSLKIFQEPERKKKVMRIHIFKI
jgi:hypothetical protein